jgi:hypothetical protein
MVSRVVAIALLTATIALVQLPGYGHMHGALHDSAHVLFAGLIAMAVWGLARRTMPATPRWPAYVLALLVTVLLTTAAEWAQYLTGRSFSPADVMRNLVGALSFLVLAAHRDVARRLGNAMTCRSGALLLGAFVLLAWGVSPFFIWSSVYVQRSYAFPAITDFGARWTDRLVESGSVRLTVVAPPADWPKVGDEKVMYLHGSRKRFTGMGIDGPYPNWSDYQRLRFVAYNPGHTNIELNIHVRDRHRDRRHKGRYEKRLDLPPGYLPVQIPIDDLRSTRRSRDLDLRNLGYISIFAPNSPAPLEFYIGNLRLEGARGL